MRNNVQASPDDIDVVEIAAAIKRNLVKLLLASLLVGLVTFVALTKMTPKYKSIAQLQFGGRAVVTQNAADPTGMRRSGDVLVKVDKQAVASQVAVIKSRDLALKLIDKLDLRKNREFNTALVGKGIVGSLLAAVGLGGSDANISEEDRILMQYDKALKVYQGKDSRVITIEFSSADPNLAAKAANTLAELYLAGRVKRTVKQSANTSSYLKPEIDKLRHQVQLAESAVEDFRGRHNLYAAGATSQRGTLNNEQLSELTRELTRAQTQKSEADARARTIRELMLRGAADASPDVMRSPLIQRLQDQRVRVERQISELSATLLPRHPRMRQLRADLAGLNRQLRNEVRKIVDGLAKEATVAGRRVAAIQASIDRLKQQVRNSGGNRAKLAELERDAKVKRQQLEVLQAQYQAAIARQRISTVPLEAELFSRARPSTIPALKRGPISALAMTGTFLLGLALVITRELLKGSRSGGGSTPNRGRRATDRHRAGDLEPGPALATVPASGSVHPAVTASQLAGGSARSDYIQDDMLPPVSSVERYAQLDSVMSLAKYLQEHAKGQNGYRTLIAPQRGGDVTSAEQAIELARMLGARGRQVILIDWSANERGLAHHMKLTSRPGMNDLLLGSAGFEDVIRKLDGSDVHFIASGSARKRGDNSIDENRLNLILDALDDAYDHIIVHGDHNGARELFETIQGRFDAGVSIVDPLAGVDALAQPPGTFLGFEVEDLNIIQLVSSAGAARVQHGSAPSTFAPSEARI